MYYRNSSTFIIVFFLGCEDIIIDSVNVENIINVVDWSSQPHGSAWVHRQALNYLREEFVQISHSSVVCDLSVEYLLEAIRSDFLQVRLRKF